MFNIVREEVKDTGLSSRLPAPDDELDEKELESRSRERKNGKPTLDAFHETSETEIAFHGDHGESDDSTSLAGNSPNKEIDSGGADDESEKSRTETGLNAKFKRARHVTGMVVNDARFQTLIVILIIVNAIMMGVATFDFVKDDPDRKRAFEITDMVFLIIFTIELAMQLFYHGLHLFLDGWLVFDFVIVVMSWAFESMQIIRAFRVFRALRLITRLDVLRSLVVALFTVMPRMAAISALLLLIFYIYGVLCTYLFKDLFADGQTDEDYFSRLDLSLLTLFQIMTLEDWGSVARQTMAVYRWAWIVFVSYVAITSFIVYNLIIAVVCDAVAVREHENDIMEAEEADRVYSEESRKRISELSGRVELLTKQQQQLLEAVQGAFQELESMEKRT